MQIGPSTLSYTTIVMKITLANLFKLDSVVSKQNGEFKKF